MESINQFFLIFILPFINQTFNLPNGSIGVLVNSVSFENRHVHAEIPRLYKKINDHAGIITEVTYDNNKDSEGVVGIRTGVRINF